ncbi:hypothetical protein FDG2_1871 [Candidatus Protofrankia californiensis]|uniref:Three-Cys-motif partner protein TcmP n=1 Tax=Candidatus Protofrankia californiensis TaxID=1839754 RepID=A0A1C3NWL0_9ACTN|nr:hypothetical protein FDG2_1871 [Candidatus Protofrankia californiensis]
MPTPSGILWPRDPHTAAKHDLLRRYLQAWFPILLHGGFSRLGYVEGFAGPGGYTGGEPGSPIIALDIFLDRLDLLRERRLDLLLLEEDRGRVAELQRRLDQTLSHHSSTPAELKMTVRRGTCGQDLLPLLREVGLLRSPIFAFLDSFGGPDISYELVRVIATNRSSEALITFGPTFLTRFGHIDKHAAAADAAFGHRGWRAVVDQPPKQKKPFLLNQYRETLRRAGFRYTLVFEIVDEGGHSLFLLFGTSNEQGLRRMKDAMWKVDPVEGVRYRDPRDPQQMLLDLELQPNTAPLERGIVDHLSEVGPRTVEQLRRFALLQTVYRSEHVPRAVRDLLQKGHVRRSPERGQLAGSSVIEVSSTARWENHEIF